MPDSETEPLVDTAGPAQESIPPPNSTMLVLLVDDQPIVGEAVRRLLIGERDIGLRVCPTAARAVALAAELRPTVILQDLVLPDIDGLELVRQYRAHPATAMTPIIVLSAKEDPMVKSQAFAAGANDYVVKLPDRAELIARIRYHSRSYLNAVQRDEAFRALHESQKRLLESNTALTTLNQQLNAFVGMAAHDLRNPLGVVLGFSKFLMRDNGRTFTPQQITFLTSIQSSADFMLHLVNDLLDVSAIEAGKLTLDLRSFDVAALVEANVALLRILAQEKGIEIVATAAQPAFLMGDARRLEQVLTNLLTNAIKYSHQQTRIDVTVAAADGRVVIAVRDRGQGIPTNELDRLFLPFSVTSVRATQGETSTGLGLMIAKKVVEAHHGRIWVESTVGEGSTFFVSLPTEKP